jgi:hypothetical protein
MPKLHLMLLHKFLGIFGIQEIHLVRSKQMGFLCEWIFPTVCSGFSINIPFLLNSVAEPHHFYAAPAPGKNFDAAPAPAPTLL